MQGLRKQAGVTFVELIITILVIGIAVTGILQVMTINTGTSADPMIRHQAIAIAEAYLDEILAKEFTDPGGPAEAGRADYDDINDYAVINNAPVQDQNGNPIGGLNGYTVTVSVTGEALGPPGAQVDAANASRVTVTVNTPDKHSVAVSGYRTNN